MTFYPRYNKTYPSKDSKIKEFAERKEKGIADYTTKQEISITVQSALRDAVSWCVNHPDWKEKQSDEDRISWIDTTAKRLLNFYAENKPKYSELYENLKRRRKEIEEKEAIAETIEIGNDDNGTYNDHLEEIKE